MRVDLDSIKARFGIIGTNAALLRAIEVAYQVAPTDLSVLVMGESGSGKEFFPQIVHQYGARKHGQYIAVNCGAIPEGTIDSELFGHVKGSFTGAVDNRKGYFEVADGGTIFLDEVAELPLPTQARLLRVLESGEFLKVGSSTVQRTDIRVIAATNVHLEEAIAQGRFREDLYYRLSTVPINVPPLRERGEDVVLLFKHFAIDFSDKYRMPAIRLGSGAKEALLAYSWPGNIRQLKNVTEQISIVEQEREITGETLQRYLPRPYGNALPALYHGVDSELKSERDLLYSVLYEMRTDMNELKHLVYDLMQGGASPEAARYVAANPRLFSDMDAHRGLGVLGTAIPVVQPAATSSKVPVVEPVVVQEGGGSLADLEEGVIRRTLEKNRGHRRMTAKELGISERTLYRKIREYGIKA